MKNTILISLFLLGVCSGKTLEPRERETIYGRSEMVEELETKKMNPADAMAVENQNMDSYNQNYRNKKMMDDWQARDKEYQRRDNSNVESLRKMPLEDRDSDSQRMRPDGLIQKTLAGLGGIKDFIHQQMSSLRHKLFGEVNEHTVTIYQSTDMPMFQDPLEIGAVVDKLALATIQYKNIEFCGLGNVYHITYQIDINSKQVVVTLPLNKVQIKGQYTASNLLRHTSGNFNIDLSGDVFYVETIPYRIEGAKVHLGECKAQVQYDKVDTQYENIGFFAQFFQGRLGKLLLDTVITKVEDEVYPKLATHIQRKVEMVTQNFHRARVVSHLQQGINSTVHDIQMKLADVGDVSINISNPYAQEYKFRQCKVKILSVVLRNVEKFVLEKNDVSYTDTMVHANVHFKLPHPHIVAFIVYQDEFTGQMHAIHARYMVESIHANLELHKDLSQGDLQLVGTRCLVSAIHVDPSQGRYEGIIGDLIEDSTMNMGLYVTKAIEEFMKTEVNGILGQSGSMSDNTGVHGSGYPTNRYSNGYVQHESNYEGRYMNNNRQFVGYENMDDSKYKSGLETMENKPRRLEATYKSGY